MNEINLDDLKLSCNAAEEIFRLNLQQWSFGVGVVNLAQVLGIWPARLKRAMKRTTLTFDLAYRVHKACSIAWSDIFTSASNNQILMEQVAKAEKERKLTVNEHSVNLAEEEVRARLLDLVREIGHMECARCIGITPSSLHYYLNIRRIPLSLIWKIHLLTGVSYSVIASGEEEESEQRHKNSLGTQDEVYGRFDDLSEPIVRLVRFCLDNLIWERAQPFVPYVEKLQQRKLSLPQRMGLMRLFARYHNIRGNARKAARLLEKAWAELRKSKANLHLLRLHLYPAAMVSRWDMYERVADYILKMTDDPMTVFRVLQDRIAAALTSRRINETANLARHLMYKMRGSDVKFKRPRLVWLENILAICAWMLGDWDEALFRTRKLLGSSAVKLSNKRLASEIELNIKIWLGDVPGAIKAIKTFAGCLAPGFEEAASNKHIDIYRLRCLLLKRDMGGTLSATEEKKLNRLLKKVSTLNEPGLEAEAICEHAICMYLAKNETKYLKNILDKLVSGKGFRRGALILALPDLLETARKAGLWSPKLEQWQKELIKKGVLNFGHRYSD